MIVEWEGKLTEDQVWMPDSVLRQEQRDLLQLEKLQCEELQKKLKKTQAPLQDKRCHMQRVQSMCAACVEHVWSMCRACVEHV